MKSEVNAKQNKLRKIFLYMCCSPASIILLILFTYIPMRSSHRFLKITLRYWIFGSLRLVSKYFNQFFSSFNLQQP